MAGISVMKPSATVRGFLALAVGAAGLAAFAGSAPLPDSRKQVIYWGWDTLKATTEDVYRLRDRFAETGFTGIGMPITGFREDGSSFRGRYPIDGDGGKRRWKPEDFERSARLVREMVGTDGLRDSYAMVYLQSFDRRLPWTDDEGWEILSHNFAVLARLVRETGLKGMFVDHEDYTRKPLFTWCKDDPGYDEAVRLARRRGRELSAAIGRADPKARIVFDRVLGQLREALTSQTPTEVIRARRDLWYPFLNGFVDGMPPEMVLVEGSEDTYRAMCNDDYRARAYLSQYTGLQTLEPALRAKYCRQSRLAFAKFIDPYADARPQDLAAFGEALTAAGCWCDEMYWVYGEKHAVVDWGKPIASGVTNVPWHVFMPGLADVLRVSGGDYSAVRARLARGELERLTANPGCDSADGRIPPDYHAGTDAKDAPKDTHAYDAAVGCANPGCLRLQHEKGYFTAQGGTVRPGDRLYFTYAYKGSEPVVDLAWKKDGGWKWYTEYQRLIHPVRTLPDGWKVCEVCLVVPKDINGFGIVLGARDVSPEKPCWFDDIGVWRW